MFFPMFLETGILHFTPNQDTPDLLYYQVSNLIFYDVAYHNIK